LPTEKENGKRKKEKGKEFSQEELIIIYFCSGSGVIQIFR
jgi:hypothetical protein